MRGITNSGTRDLMTSLLRHCRRLIARIVPALGAYDESSTARLGVHLHGSVTAAAHRRGGFVPDCVLVTDIVRDRPADCVDLVKCLREKSNPARPVGHYL